MNLADLKAPFDPSKISWRLGSTNGDKTKGVALAYIDARDVMERLDDVCGLGWQAEYVSMQNGTCCCRIGIKVGDEWIWRSNGALNLTDSDKSDAKEMAEKGSYSDAFKRAAVLFGIGRYLYDLESPWVAIVAAGRSFKIADGEYARLEGLLRRDASKPSKAHSVAPQKAQDGKTVPPAKITPHEWAKTAMGTIRAINGPEIDKWLEQNSAALVKLRASQPILHSDILALIQQRQAMNV